LVSSVLHPPTTQNAAKAARKAAASGVIHGNLDFI
jgi:hypothetical protein